MLSGFELYPRWVPLTKLLKTRKAWKSRDIFGNSPAKERKTRFTWNLQISDDGWRFQIYLFKNGHKFWVKQLELNSSSSKELL